VTLIIRPATPADAAAISAIHIDARCQAYADLMSPEALSAMIAEVTPEKWANRLRYWRGWGLVAVENGGTIIGFVYTAPNHEGRPGVGDIEALHVDPAHQGTGVGERLLDAGLEVLAQQGFSAFELWVLEGNERAIQFYLKRGWRPDGERAHEFGGDFLRFVF